MKFNVVYPCFAMLHSRKGGISTPMKDIPTSLNMFRKKNLILL